MKKPKKSVKNSLHARPFLFLLALTHTHLLIFFLLKDHLLIALVDLLPPSLLVLSLHLHLLLCLLLLRTTVIGFSAEGWEHLVYLLLVGGWLLFDDVLHFLEIVFEFDLYLFLHGQVWEISLIH